ncbi:hypothetical protein [Mucilaginibacter phyllosphaerae]|uniref:Lipoprotein n=1 Tax=Mucilaginibacter phyllosphaerae TaxID=1812349 RepID=A0A4Y8A794_9SPHI|nr:hypothetical protein [Mucilaginibacter phyllosphaerae]MBB3970811.1 hypothetical protein [Mucilaginibacter phyllosphaerae]TEW64250.1 hypothetical protein E2R65_18045 [Mucilaginibacter phyllosphaerae]GGH04760.1 hypothetical protein GCM10007352_08140 [Mucilaginibacter phyllosphaerae]
MQIRSIVLITTLFLSACSNPTKTPVAKSPDTVAVKTNSVKFNEAYVQSLYAKSDLVARIKVTGAVKHQEIYVIDARLIEVYKGKTEKQPHIKYEAFLEEGDYKEFIGKELIMFLTSNKQDKKLYNEGVHWSRTEPNVEFAFDNDLKNYLLNLK